MNFKACLICGATMVEKLLDLGPQPVSNRFMRKPDERQAVFPLALGQCGECGLLQLFEPVPAAELVPPYEWAATREPERHLDEAVACAIEHASKPEDRLTVCGLSYKDDSTLERFRRLGCAKAWRLNPAQDLGIESRTAGVESVQAALTPERATSIAARLGRADLIVARHVLEHAHAPATLAEALRAMLATDGMVMFEMPDFQVALERGDYTALWEEHILYFTTRTLPRSLARLGFDVAGLFEFPNPPENNLIVLARSAVSVIDTYKPDASELADARQYAAGFEPCRARVRRILGEFRAARGPIALFGAGHMACKFVNFFGVRDLLEFAADDHPAKVGMFLPGSGLPVLASSALLERGVKLCLLTVGPESEQKVVARNAEFAAAGGVFASIFPGSAIPMDALASGA